MKDYILEENIFAIAGFNNPNQTLDKKNEIFEGYNFILILGLFLPVKFTSIKSTNMYLAVLNNSEILLMRKYTSVLMDVVLNCRNKPGILQQTLWMN